MRLYDRHDRRWKQNAPIPDEIIKAAVKFKRKVLISESSWAVNVSRKSSFFYVLPLSSELSMLEFLPPQVADSVKPWGPNFWPFGKQLFLRDSKIPPVIRAVVLTTIRPGTKKSTFDLFWRRKSWRLDIKNEEHPPTNNHVMWEILGIKWFLIHRLDNDFKTRYNYVLKC